MTALTRRLQQGAAGSAGIVSGAQLSSLFLTSPTATLAPNLTTNVGPNAWFRSATYPLPAATDLTGSPLKAITPDGSRWLFDGTNEAGLLAQAWGSTTAPYVPGNSPANHGGVVQAGGATIDGYPVTAGSYVFQWCDFQGTSLNLVDGTGVVFRGCRNRAAWGNSTGSLNCGSWPGELHVHWCDMGAQSSLTAGGGQYGISASGGHNFSLYRNYVSYGCDMFVVNPQQAGYCEMTENLVEKICLYPDTGTQHLDGMQTNGNAPNMRVLRNSMVIPAFDEQGNPVNQTGGISFFQDFGPFPGTGTNIDGSLGYVISGNYIGGMGYCYYLGQAGGNPPGSVTNMTFTSNRVTTQIYSTGGFNGPVTFPPPFGSFGNTQAGNLWADGPSAGQSFL